MIKFLNTGGLNREIPNLIKNAERELIIVVPFIISSNEIYDSLILANKRKVEITIICRLNEINEIEKKKLFDLENLNLLSHPNVHSKCYYSEDCLIITSINMTSHSEKNNREMGVLIEEDEGHFNFDDDWVPPEDNGYVTEDFMDDFKEEIQQLLNGSKVVKKSIQTTARGFSSELLKSYNDILKEQIDSINEYFAPKKFELDFRNDYSDFMICKNYIDKFNLIIKDIDGRFELEPNKGKISDWDKKLKRFHSKVIYIKSRGGNQPFTLYLNKGSKLNIVGEEELFEDIEFKDKLIIWESVLDEVSALFTKEILKI